MPIQIFTAAERTRLDAFPEEITHDDLITFFTLSEADREQLPLFSAPHNRLGFANEGIIRRRQEEAHTNQAQCLNLLTNAVVVWNTLYMERVLEVLAQESGRIEEADIALVSPARSAHLNPYGKFYFEDEREFRRKGFRPLR